MPTNLFSWETAPLPEAKRRLAELEKLLQDARIKVAARERIPPKVYTCWSQQHALIVPKSVMALCKGQINDGKEAFRDDSAKNDEGIITPIRVCSYLCFRCYQDYSNQKKIERNKR